MLSTCIGMQKLALLGPAVYSQYIIVHFVTGLTQGRTNEHTTCRLTPFNAVGTVSIQNVVRRLSLDIFVFNLTAFNASKVQVMYISTAYILDMVTDQEDINILIKLEVLYHLSIDMFVFYHWPLQKLNDKVKLISIWHTSETETRSISPYFSVFVALSCFSLTTR